MTHRWLCTLEPIHPMLFFQWNSKTPIYCGTKAWSDWSRWIQKMVNQTKVKRKGVSYSEWCWCRTQICEKYCKTNQSPSLPFFGPHTKSHGFREFSKHYHVRFDPKIGHFICAICRIPCVCSECTYMLDKPWIPVLTPKQQPRHQPVTDFSYWSVLGSSNNLNILKLSHKATTSEYF